MTIERITRDNTCNNENDFDYDFTWTVYGAKQDEWYYDGDEQYIGLCEHRGGDVRGNYGMPRFFRVGDNLAETGFIDWTLSWHCTSGPDQDIVDRINEECSAGYTSNPTYHLSEILGTDDCEWIDGEAHVHVDEMGMISGKYVVCPAYYGGDACHGDSVVNIPEDGRWLHDASIDTGAWIEAVLMAGDAEEITETVLEVCDYVHGSQPEWDDSEGVLEALRVYHVIDAEHGQGASKAIIEELDSDVISDNLPADMVAEIKGLHKTLVTVIDHAHNGVQFIDADDVVYDFMTNAGV